MTADYTYLLTDFPYTEVLEELPLSSVTTAKKVNGSAGFNATMPIATPGFNKLTRSAIQGGRRMLWVMRDEVVQYGGIIWRVAPKISGDTLQIGGQDSWSMLEGKRHLRVDKTYTSLDQFALVRDLVDYAQNTSNRDFGLVVTGNTSGITRTERYFGGDVQGIGKIIKDLSGRSDGFDFKVSPSGSVSEGFTSTLTLANRLGRSVESILQVGKNIRLTNYNEDAFEMANLVIGVGSKQDGDVVPPVVEVSDVNGFLEMEAKTTSVLQGNGLRERAEAELQVRLSPVRYVEFEIVGDDPDATFASFDIGDDVRIISDYFWATFDERFRIESLGLSVDENGREVVTGSATQLALTV